MNILIVDDQQEIAEKLKIDFCEYKEERKKYTDFAYEDNVIEYYFNAYEYSAYKGDSFLALFRKSQNRCIIDEIYGEFENINPEIFGGFKCEAVVEGKQVYALAHFNGEKFNIKFRVPME